MQNAQRHLSLGGMAGFNPATSSPILIFPKLHIKKRKGDIILAVPSGEGVSNMSLGHDRVRSLREVLELEGRSFLGATTELRAIITIIDLVTNKQAPVGAGDRDNTVLPHLEKLTRELTKVNARSALVSASRLIQVLESRDGKFTYENLRHSLNDIESRFADHIIDITLFALSEQETMLMAPMDSLVGQAGLSSIFPSTAFEFEEAGKCLALGRHTASVFHTMRVLEIGIGSLAKFLKIPDPVKTTDRNWGTMLKSIKEKIDEKWPKNARVKNSEGAKVEGLYATLDAVKNPWRNATMHVETIYAPHEAFHILNCTAIFMSKLGEHCDENGDPPP